MRPAHRAFFGLIISTGLVLAAIAICTAFQRYGFIVWFPVIGAGYGAAFVWGRYPRFRQGVQASAEAVLEFLGGMNMRQFDERRLVPRSMRSLVLDRAKNRCQFPGCTEARRSHLDIHHISEAVTPKFSRDNLIAVCLDHHWEIHRRDDITDQQVRGWALGEHPGS
jgi:hypothetical protein